LGSVFLPSGVLAILFAVFVYSFNMNDEGPRCSFGGCAPSLLNYYNEVFVSMTILAIIGLVAASYGIYLLMRKDTVIPSLPTESNAEKSANPPKPMTQRVRNLRTRIVYAYCGSRIIRSKDERPSN
jgi:hypothetical protein